MTGKEKTEKRLYSITKISIWMGVLVLGVIAVGLSLYYDSSDWLEISVGLFSGAIISFITSFTITIQDDKEDKEQYADTINLLNSIGNDLQSADAANGIRIYQNNKNDGLNLETMISGAKRRIWILGTDLSNTLIRFGDEIVKVCTSEDEIELRVLALHPQNVFLNVRYGEIGWGSVSEMRQSVYEAQQNLAEMKKKIQVLKPDAVVDIKLYLSQPTVTMFIIDDEMVISHLMTGERSSDSLQLCCDLNICRKLNGDFIDGHFEQVWKNAIPIEESLCYSKRDSVYSLTENGESTEYCFLHKGDYIKNIKKSIRVLANRVHNVIECHGAALSVPVISIVAAAGFLWLMQGIKVSDEYVLNTYYTSTALGFISGGILSIIEYCMESWYDQIQKKRNENAKKQEIKTIMDCLNEVLFNGKVNEHGVVICDNRNSAGIKERILNATSRVWIYATNHRYISSIGVQDFLNEHANTLDVRFLMLSPQSLFVSTRYSEIPGKKSADEFADEISNNLKHLLNEYKNSHNVDIRLYTRQPKFMMYLIDDTLIISHILKQGRARDQSHFIFDLSYPHINMAADDYINHFLTVWDEAVKCRRKNSNYRSDSVFTTVQRGLNVDVRRIRKVSEKEFRMLPAADMANDV